MAYKAYSRRMLSGGVRAWMRGNAKFVSLFACGALVATGAATASIALTVDATRPKWFLLGAVPVGLLVYSWHMLSVARMAHDRDAMRHLRGAWGEETTRDELNRALRKRLIWGWVDSVTVQGGDIDHLVVTRDGGVIAIDSKFRSAESLDLAPLVRSASVARLRADGVVRTVVAGRTRGSHRLPGNPLNCRAAIVLWGPAQHDVGMTRLGDVDVIPGRQLVEWLRGLSGEPVGEEAALAVLRGVEEFRNRAWASTTGSREHR
ncbi:MAG: nuclease-related domain-containing protein [Marmoricola sp.]